jgi:hypothetical protein
MDFVIEFNPAAFDHGVTEADIRSAFDTSIYDAMPCRNIYHHLLKPEE